MLKKSNRRRFTVSRHNVPARFVSFRKNGEHSSDRGRKKSTSELALTLATWVIGIAGVFSFGAALIQAYLFGGQLSVMQRQLTDSEIQEAASISIKNFSVIGFPDNTKVIYDLSNDGKTRADQILPEIVLSTIPVKDELEIFGREKLTYGTPNVNGFSLSPSDQPRHIVSDLRLRKLFSLPATIRDDVVKGGQTTVYVMVVAPYFDVFGHEHETSDCLIWRAQTKSFEACTAQHDRHY